MKFLEIKEEEYVEFFKWILDKDDIKIEKEADLLLASSYNEPYIYYTEEIQDFFCTEPMKRIAQVNQLGTSINFNDNAYHTRLEHCKGSYKNALDFWILKCNDLEYKKKVDENPKMKNLILADIMEMARHDDCHTMLSHALEELICNGKANHEDIGKRILLENEEYKESLNNIRSGLYEAMCENAINDKSAFKLLREGNTDFDRMDYIMRDLLYLGLPYSRELIENLIRNCNINKIEINGKMEETPVYNMQGLQYVEEFLQTREQGYEHEYSHTDRKVLDSVVKSLCIEILKNKSIDSKFIRKAVENYMQENINDINLDEFLQTNDIKLYTEIIDLAINSEDENIKELATLCLPSITGLLQIGVEMLDTKKRGKDLENYSEYELDFIQKLKDLRSEDNDLKLKMENENKRKLFNATVFSEETQLEDYTNRMKQILKTDNLNATGIITWNKPIKVYKKSEPVYVEDETGKIYTLDNYPNLSLDISKKDVIGMAVVPSIMKLSGYSESTIKKAKKLIEENNLKCNNTKKDFHNNRMSKFQVGNTPYLIGFEEK